MELKRPVIKRTQNKNNGVEIKIKNRFQTTQEVFKGNQNLVVHR